MIYDIVILIYLIFGIRLIWKKYKEWKKYKVLAANWSKVAKAYPKKDFGAINLAVKKIKPVAGHDIVFLMLEAERYLYGQGVFKDMYKVVELLKEVNATPLPEKLPIEKKHAKHPRRKKLVEKRKDVKKRIKKDKYIKNVKKIAREVWNGYELWEIDHEIRRGSVERDIG